MMQKPNRFFTFLLAALFVALLAPGCIKDMPREIVLKEKGKGRGACFGVIHEIADSEKSFVVFKTPDGKGTYKVKTDKNGFFVLNRKPGEYRLVSYSYVNATGTVNVQLAAGLPMEVAGDKIRYVGRIFSSPIDKNVYLVDNYVRDIEAFRSRYGSRQEIESALPNEEYYRLMKAHLAPSPAPPAVRSGSAEPIESTVFLLGDVWPGSEVSLEEIPNVSEIPPHQVQVDSFSIDRFPVTNRQFLAFLQETNRPFTESCRGNAKLIAGKITPGWEEKPVTCISHDLAQAYCQSRGKDLPTEAQWELAARGKPWGDRFYGGIQQGSKPGNQGGDRSIGDPGWKPSPYGVSFDGQTLVEWVSDRYAPRYYQESPERNPMGPAKGDLFVARSGPYRFALDKTYRSEKIGFRCAEYSAAHSSSSAGFAPGTAEPVKTDPAAESRKIEERIQVVKKAKIYESPTIASAIVDEVRPGTALILLDQDAGWYRVRMNDGREGYLFEDFARRILP